MKKSLTLFILLTSFLLGNKVYGQTLTKENISEYSYYMHYNYKYNNTVNAVLKNYLRSIYIDLSTVEVGMESIHKDKAFRENTFDFWYKVYGGNKDFLFANISSLGISAKSAKNITDYIYLTRKEKERISTQQREIELLKVKKIERQKKFDVNSSNFNLLEISPTDYNQFVNDFKKGLIKQIVQKYNLEADIIRLISNPQKLKYNDSLNVDVKANVLYTFRDQNRHTDNINTYLRREEDKISTQISIHNFNTDKLDVETINDLYMKLPGVTKNGVQVTQLDISINDVSYKINRGIATAKIKKGKVISIEGISNDYIKSQINIRLDLENLPKGKYLIAYELCDIMGLPSTKIKFVKQ